jgi:hypothetical protein
VNLDTNQALLSVPLSHFSQMAMNELGSGLDTMYFYVTVHPKPPKTPSGMDGPPYSGLVDYQQLLEEKQFGTTSSGALLEAAFYGGGAAQTDFDAWVARKRRQLGIMDDREPSGVCRAVSPDDALSDDLRPPTDTVTHVAAGAADVVAFSLPDTEQVGSLRRG